MLIPSIDIAGGKVVQLRQGRELVLTVDRDPLELAKEFNRYGQVAVVDLDAAMGVGSNLPLIEKICRVADVRVGGGIRDVEIGRRLLKAGARCLIVGTMATPEFLSNFPAELIMVALDQRSGKVVDHGWRETTADTVATRAQRLGRYCAGFLCTFVEIEGLLCGMPLEPVAALAKMLPKPLTVAGGIATTEEVVAISRLGVDVQVGLALHRGSVNPVESVVGAVTFGPDRLVPTIVQDEAGQQVLMMAYSSPESLRQALTQGKGVYFSRSRNEIWEKGLTSGSRQELISCRLDCDRDCLLFQVRQTNGACHTGSYSCFDRATSTRKFSLPALFDLLKQLKAAPPEGSYSASLLSDRRRLLRKIMEEAFEVVSFQSRENLRWELADILYHLSVLAVDEGIDWKEIESELNGRRH